MPADSSDNSTEQVRITYDEMQHTLEEILRSEGVSDDNSRLCSRVITQSTFDGILSHGIRRFIPLIEGMRSGSIKANAESTMVSTSGVVEIWDGHLGIGIVNGVAATNRAVEIATESGIGCVALNNTTHWLRAGSYGWQAVSQGFALICWTNTISNMPAWGDQEKSVGNNPLVIAVPGGDYPFVLDMAMSQYSMGSLHLAAESGDLLSAPGGYGLNGELTNDAREIVETGRPVPMGFWKGSGLAILLDALAVFISGGKATLDHDAEGSERGVSQVFLAFDPEHTIGKERAFEHIERIAATFNDRRSTFPGARTLERRASAMKSGVLLDSSLWKRIIGLR